jgi:hypothetical protein
MAVPGSSRRRLAYKTGFQDLAGCPGVHRRTNQVMKVLVGRQRTGPAPRARAACAQVIAVMVGLATISVVPLAVQVPPAAASAGVPVWHVSKSPKLRVDVATGCPASVAAYQDVANTFPGPPLVPANPRVGIICRYGPSTAKPGPARLVHQARLDQTQADLLAGAVRQLSLAPPRGISHCPADFGLVAIIGFSFSGRPDVGLWYQTSGCQTLDNGRIGSFEGGNPSFYNRFLSVVDRLSPPVNG